MAADQLTDKEDQFKRRARRRLVGAVALVLLMITLLPMVLDDRSGQKASQPEIAISIPSQEGTEFTSKIVPAPVTPAPETPVSIASPVEKPVAVTEKAPAPVEKLAAPEPAAKPEAVAPVVAEKPQALEPSTVVAEVKPEKAEPAKTAATENKSKPTGVTKGSISVQIGVFSDAAKVKQMRAKIADSGIQCYTENMATPKGTKYRVRCGPFAEKPAAQQALDKLKSLGYNGILVTNQ